jgi:hypothetical protein
VIAWSGRLGEFGFARQLGQGRFCPGAQRLSDRLRALPTFGSPTLGRRADDRLFDPVEIADAIKGFLGDRRAVSGMDVEELAPDMGPTSGLGDPVAGEQFVESGPRVRPKAGPRTGATVGVDDPPEVLQMRPRVLAPRFRGGRPLRSGE